MDITWFVNLWRPGGADDQMPPSQAAVPPRLVSQRSYLKYEGSAKYSERKPSSEKDKFIRMRVLLFVDYRDIIFNDV